MSEIKGNYDKFKNQILDISDKYDLMDYHAFIFWFGHTILGYPPEQILDFMCDGTHDKGIDAIFIDKDERKIMVVQSKYEIDGNKTQAKENDIKLLAVVKDYFSKRSGLNSILHNANQVVSRLAREAFEKIKKEKYELELVFITTHKEVPNINNIMKNTLNFKKGDYSLFFYNEIMLKFADSLRDYTPDIGTYNLKFNDNDKAIIKSGKKSNFNSWVLTVPLDDVRQMSNKYKNKLFRKNVRNFLGKSICNKGLLNTLEKDQNNFWYYNNGITILADEASIVMEEGYIRLKNPQVVNGCQTVRSIEHYSEDLVGNLLVRVIESKDHDFINKLTLFQNMSNPVSNRDLKANDPTQVRLKHQFAHKKIYFEIKRGEEYKKICKQYPSTKRMYKRKLNNEDVAKLLATIRLSPHIAGSKGSKLFFGEKYEDIFNDNVTTTEILALDNIYDELWGEFQGKKDFHEFVYHYVFKGRAIFLVLKYIYDSINSKQWHVEFMKFCNNSSNDEYNKFSKKFEKIVTQYFNIIYREWKKSKEPYHNTFLQAKDTYTNIKKNNKETMNNLKERTQKLFKKILD